MSKLLCTALLLSLTGSVVPAPRAKILVTPESVRIAGALRASKNSIAEALTAAGPGDLIELAPGDYQAFGIGFEKRAAWNARTKGGSPGNPITVLGRGQVRIIGKGEAIKISQQVPHGWITFRNVTIVPGYRSGVMFFNGPQVHRGYKFLDCNIIGAWDHVKNQGTKSKWGVYGRLLADFEFRGTTRPAVVQDIRSEHGFYLQNPQGDILIENVVAKRLGRTFVQFTARAKEGPAGIGNITVRGCKVEDVCIAPGDDYKGGSAFTVAGRLTGRILFEDNTYRAGFDRALLPLTRKDAPYGTGAFVAWMGGETVPNGELILRDNAFELARGCGDRALVAIGGCESVEISGLNRFVAGSEYPALDIEPIGKQRQVPSPVDKLSIAPETQIRGAIRRRGQALRIEDLK
jgi:hypothetical protein